MKFGQYLKNYRKENNMNLSEFQNVTGVPQEHLKRLEDGTEMPSLSIVEMVAKGMSKIDNIRFSDILRNLQGYAEMKINNK